MHRFFEGVVLLPRFMLATVVPLSLWAVGTYFLLFSPQARDLVAGSTADGWHVRLVHLVLYHLGVWLWALSAWYWTRWAISLVEVYPPEPQAPAGVSQHRLIGGPGPWLRRTIPRLLIFISPLVALGPAFPPAEGFRPRVGYWALHIVVALASSVLLLAFTVYRDRVPNRVLGISLGFLKHDLGKPPFVLPNRGNPGWRTCAGYLPFGPRSWLFWVLGFVVLSTVVVLFPVSVPVFVGAAAMATAGLAGVLAVLSLAAIGLRRAWGLPSLVILLLWFLASTAVSNNHAVRRLPSQGQRPESALAGPLTASAARGNTSQPNQVPAPSLRAPVAGRQDPTLMQAFEDWRRRCHGGATNPSVLLVATAGGASRAAMWTASVLAGIEAEAPAGLLRRHMFAVSGVSGGSLGASAIVASMPPEGCEAEEGSKDVAERHLWVRRFLQSNFLPAPVAGYLTTDFLSSLSMGLLPLKDRAAALEESWEDRWRATRPDGLREREDAMASSFLGLWGHGTRWARPVLLLNGTHAESGLTALTAPVRVNRREFALALDAVAMMESDLRLSTAVTNSARFPIITPPGTLRTGGLFQTDRVVDGGVFENYGAGTLRDVAAALRKRVGELALPVEEIIVVQVSSDPSLRRDEIPRCGEAPDEPLATAAAAVPWATGAFASLSALGQTRSMHGIRAAGDLRHQFCETPGPGGVRRRSYFHFALCGDPEEGVDGETQERFIQLNWVLSDKAQNFLWPENRNAAVSALRRCGNGEELELLVQRLQSR